MRKENRFLGLFIFLAICVSVGLSSVAGSAEKVTLMLNWLPQGHHSGIFAAVDQGFYKREGVEVEVIRGYGSGDTIKKIASGAAPLGFSDYGSLVFARSRGVKVKGIGVYYAKNLHGLYTLKRHGIDHPSKLNGRSIAEAPGGAIKALLPAFQKAVGIESYEFVPVAPSAKNALLISGKVHAIGTLSVVLPILQRMARKQGEEVVEFLFSDYGIEFYSHGFLVRDDVDDSETVRNFMHGSMKGIAWAIEHPAEAVDIFVKSHPDWDEEIASAAWKIAINHIVTPDAQRLGLGHMTREKMQRTIDILSKYQDLKRKVTPEEMYTNKFLPKVFPKRQ